MTKRILLTTTSYQDTPGPHHELLASSQWEVVAERGPLSERRMLALTGEFDGFLCGDDAITAAVIDKSLPRLRVISKYGIGLDKIDVAHATEQRIPVLYTPGVNHTTVAEHAFALMLEMHRNLTTEVSYVSKGEWKRITGNELWGKTLGIVGLGRIGQEVAKRAHAFGMQLIGFGNYWDQDFASAYTIERAPKLEELLLQSDIVSIHTKLSKETRSLIDADAIDCMKWGSYLVNCARGEIVVNEVIIDALNCGKLAGYASDVLDQEPPPPNHPLINHPKCAITPHIGSRTIESVERQATMATNNLIRYFNGETPLAQANPF